MKDWNWPEAGGFFSFWSFFHFFVCVFFLFVFGGSWRGLLASVGSFGCHLVPILESFSSLFRDRVDL